MALRHAMVPSPAAVRQPARTVMNVLRMASGIPAYRPGLAGSLLVLATAVAVAQAPPVSFEDVTVRAGLSAFRHVAGSPGKGYIIEALGSGVAMLDLNGDGWLDIYLVNGGTLDVEGGRLASDVRAALYLNRGDGTFAHATEGDDLANERWGQGVCAGDYDNDGDVDLFVANIGVSRLLMATAPGRFTDVAPAAGVAVQGGASGCAFGDYDNDGWLDLFVSGYVRFDPRSLPPAPGRPGAARDPAAPGAPRQAAAEQAGMPAAYTTGATVCRYRGVEVMCGPQGLPGEADYLFRNNGDGTFTDVTATAGVVDADRRYGFGVGWIDLDDDGWLDLVVSNDSGPNHVYRNRRDGTFEDVSYLSGAALDGSGREQAHMGLAVGDYDNDGRTDLHITNFADDFNVLYHNRGDFDFEDVSHRMGVASPSLPFLGWGTDFLDYDNDGWKDLLVVNGHVYPQADREPWNSSYAQRALLFRNLQGRRFEEVGAAAGAGVTTPRAGRGSAVGDYDNDGALDVLIGVLDGAPALVRNVGGADAGHWLSIRLIGDPAQRCPRDAIGSVVVATVGGRRLRGEVASGRGQVSQSDTRVHLGLGDATTLQSLEVRWAGGTTRTYAVEGVDRFVTIDQRTGRVSYQVP